MVSPEPDKDGMIPCDCCNNGKRVRRHGGKPEIVECSYCKGTLKRKAPPHYRSQSQIDAERAANSENDTSVETELDYLLNKALQCQPHDAEELREVLISLIQIVRETL